jgi:quercetin dioxygenase-like cupin family protein
MKRHKISDFTRGWFIGHFEKSVLRTDQFEVALIQHKKNEHWPAHIHKVATEYNVLIKGKMIICGEEINEGDLFILEPNEVAEPVFLEDCTVLCVKTPSVTGDKYEIL